MATLMFDAYNAAGQLQYTGTDVMSFTEGGRDAQPAGMVKRIVTVNHKSGVCYSAAASSP